MTGITGFSPPKAGEAHTGEFEESRSNLHRKIEQAIVENKLPNVELLKVARDHYGLLSRDGSLSLAVQWQLFHASHAHITAEGTLEQGPDFGFAHLSSQDLTDLYRVLNQYQSLKGADSIFFSHTFDIADLLFRRSIHSRIDAEAILSKIESFHDEHLIPLEQKLRALAPTGFFTPIFHRMVRKSEDIASCHWQDYRIEKRDAVERPKRKLKAVKVALETSRNAVGGLGAVLKASQAAHKSLKHESVHGIHAFYTHDKARIPAQFKGVILHEFKGEMVESSVYKDVETGDYLIQPPSKFKSLFDVRSTSQIYASHSRSELGERSLYLASASAAFIALYSGKEGNKAIDVIQGDASHIAGPLFELMATRIDHMVAEAGLHRSARTFLTHMLTPCPIEQGTMPTAKLNLIGANTSGYDATVNATASGLIHSDARIFVSKGVRAEALSENPIKNAGLRAPLLTRGRETVFRGEIDILGLTNGIDTSTFDICNPREFKRFALQPTRAGAGDDADMRRDFVTHQARLKATLASQNLIADPEKPLFLFAGRYSSEKGINMLPAMVEAAIAEGGQCVVMGLKCEDRRSIEIIEDLKRRANDPPLLGKLKVYMERDDQMGTFKLDGEDTGVKKGWLLRSCASVVMVPSHAEACGLVPMEAHCTGAMVIAPANQGLIDMCVPIDDGIVPGRNLFEGGNSFMYPHHDSVEEACDAVLRAARFIQRLSPEELNRYMETTHDYAVSTYGWINRTESGNITSGTAVAYSQVYHDAYHRLHPGQERVETFQEAVQRVRLTLEDEAHAIAVQVASHASIQDALTVHDSSEQATSPVASSTIPDRSIPPLPTLVSQAIANDADSIETSASGTAFSTFAALPSDFLSLVAEDKKAACQKLLQLVSKLPENEEFDSARFMRGIRDLFAKVTDPKVLASTEPAIATSSFFKDANRSLEWIISQLDPPLSTQKELALLQLVCAGELCSSGVIDNLHQCTLLLRNRNEETLQDFVKNTLRDHQESLFDSSYTAFLGARPDSSHPRQAFRNLFEIAFKSPEAAEHVYEDPFLDKAVFPEFESDASKEGLLRELSALYNPNAAVMRLSEQIQRDSDRRDQLVDWFKSHVPADFLDTLDEEDREEFSQLMPEDHADWMAYQYLMKFVYNDLADRIRPEAILHFLKENNITL